MSAPSADSTPGPLPAQRRESPTTTLVRDRTGDNGDPGIEAVIGPPAGVISNLRLAVARTHTLGAGTPTPLIAMAPRTRIAEDGRGPRAQRTTDGKRVDVAHGMTRHRRHRMPPDHGRSAAPGASASAPLKLPATPTATSEAVVAAGPAFARVEQRIVTRRQQTALVLAMLTVAGAALATGHHGALAIVVACVVTAIALAASLVMLSRDRHVRVLELIADGHGGLPLAAVRRERRRLLAPSQHAELARSLHELADQAPLRLARPPSGRRLTPLVLAALVAELHATACRLEEQPVGLRGVALTELLLTAHDSPVYRIDPGRLREDLGRIAFALGSIEPRADSGPHETTPCAR